MDFLSDKIADRLGGRDFGRGTTVYKFAMIKQAKAEARRAHPHVPLIDMGVGEPDIPANPSEVQTLAQAAVLEHLIREALISTAPWDDAGAYLRFSVTFEGGRKAGDRGDEAAVAAAGAGVFASIFS